MDPNRLIPSMFHRRLTLVALVMIAMMFVLAVRLFALTVIDGSARRSLAELRLDQRTFLPTYRGRILDRAGRHLAVDSACYDIAVDYRVINDAWPRDQAFREARRAAG